MTSVLAWGLAEHGQLGIGGHDDVFISKPIKVTNFDDIHVASISVGEEHALVVTQTGSVYSCGSNNFGQLGHELSGRKPEPVPSFESLPVMTAAAGKHHSLVLTSAGDVFSWGSNSHGQLGLGSRDSDRHPLPKLVKLGKKVVQVSTGEAHCLALTNESVIYSWGVNSHGQLGHGEAVTIATNVQPINSIIGLPIRQIACGANSSFLLTCSGALFGWGDNSSGQLGLNDTKERFYPCHCKPLRYQNVKYISCGEEHTVVLTKNGTVFSFGNGRFGQLGHSSFTNEIIPRTITELMGSTITQIACGRHHTLVFLESRGRIYSFGLGCHGQLGSGSTTKFHNPCAIHGSFVPAVKDTSHVAMESEECFVVKAVYTGGDQCYCVATTDRTKHPLDFREVQPSTQVLCLNRNLAGEMHSLQPNSSLSTDLADIIELVFSSLGCINASLLTPGDSHFGCNKSNSGVDFKSVEEVFRLLSDTHNHAALNLMTTSVEERLMTQFSNHQPPDVEALRVYLLIPMLPMFNENKQKTMILPYTAAIRTLTEAASTILELWWTNMKPSYLNHVIKSIKKTVLAIHEPSPKLNKNDCLAAHTIPNLSNDVINCMQVLKKLNNANEMANQIVPYSTFYIDELNELINIGSDYLSWLKRFLLGWSSNMPNYHITFCDFPFVFNAMAKSILLQTDAQVQMQIAVDEAHRRNMQSFFLPIDPSNPCLVLCVSRDNIVQDTLSQIVKQDNADFKKPLKVLFRNEEAMDAGGVKKEFFILLIREVINPQYGMFTYYEESRLLWFSHTPFEESRMFFLIGVLCGLAIYNNIIIDLHVPLALFKKFLARPATLDDLKELMPSVGRSLQDILDYEADDFVEAFELTFALSQEVYGEISTVDLMPDGSQVPVTQDNKHDYVHAYVDYIFNKSVKDGYEPFADGFHKVSGSRVMELFQPMELQALVIGNEEYDWNLFEENAEYKEGYNKQHHTVKSFWIVFHSLTLEQKKKFLLFLTGSDRIPILGMKGVPIIIQAARGGDNYYPVAHTCFNLLDLPVYQDIEKLRDRLLHAIEHTKGFTLV